LNEQAVGQEVTVCGWANVVRDQSHQMFIDLRDRSGIVQCVVDRDQNEALHDASQGIRAEYCLRITGTVQTRLPGKENPKVPTGNIEVQAREVEILNTAKTPPFEIVDDTRASEDVRLQYRYLDLRRKPMRDVLELRHRLAKGTRDFLDGEGFWEVETPLLWKSTPEGAREYVVPTRTQPGKAFVLPQSPQISKQLLMVGGVEKYFQIARCFRDESARSDRQPEFTQIDIEMSFVEQDDVLDLTERLFAYLMREVMNVEVALPFPRLTYKDAIDRYGSDKPDTRFGMELVDLSDLAVGSGFKVFANAVATGGQVKAICAKGCAEYSRKDVEGLTDLVKRFGARGPGYVRTGRKRNQVAGRQVLHRRTDAGNLPSLRRADRRPGDVRRRRARCGGAVARLFAPRNGAAPQTGAGKHLQLPVDHRHADVRVLARARPLRRDASPVLLAQPARHAAAGSRFQQRGAAGRCGSSVVAGAQLALRLGA
jgi:aspartyl-tRNA synthetase